jgi:hypothetical protein
MGGQVYGPFVSSDTKGYRANPGISPPDWSFGDPWEHEILYFRSSRVQPSATGIDTVFLPVGQADINKTFFRSDDCSKDIANGPLDDPSTKPVFLKMIYAAGTNAYSGGNVQGSDSYLLISAGPDGQYYTADDIIESK